MYCISIGSEYQDNKKSMESYRNAVLAKATAGNIHTLLDWLGDMDNLFEQFVKDKRYLSIITEMRRGSDLIYAETGVSIEFKD